MEQPESNPTFCTNNCGFYGSSQFEGMCSKCFREQVNRSYNTALASSCTSFYSSANLPVTSASRLPEEEDTADNAISSIENDNSDDQSKSEDHASPLPHVASAPTISMTFDSPTKNDSDIAESSSLGASPLNSSSAEKKKRNRCTWDTCNKKLGLTGFDCRCGGQFCSLHRYANEHNCTFDYKEHGQNEIRKTCLLCKPSVFDESENREHVYNSYLLLKAVFCSILSLSLSLVFVFVLLFRVGFT